MNKLQQNENYFFITSRKIFDPHVNQPFKKTSIKLAFDFAYDMSFGKKGEHRCYRSGGSNRRKNGEIFINTFQGKLAEFAIYNTFNKKFEIAKPDLETFGLGIWDKYDFKVNDKNISVKSTKFFGNLLLLETKDWTSTGLYIPNNNEKYDFFILTRIAAMPFNSKELLDGEKLMTQKRFLFSDNIERKTLENLILNNHWYYDIPGFITYDDFLKVIDKKFILPKGSKLNTYTKMDAENYYVQAGDMGSINELFNLI